jgi:hypothetical protein
MIIIIDERWMLTHDELSHRATSNKRSINEWEDSVYFERSSSVSVSENYDCITQALKNNVPQHVGDNGMWCEQYISL